MNRNTVVIIRSNGINPDPRVEKEAMFLAKTYDVKILAWDRKKEMNKIEKRNGYIISRCHLKGHYGSGIKNIFYIILWMVYEFFWLLGHHFDIIHACDLDTYLPAFIVAKIKKKKIIYDIFDFYADMLIGIPSIFKKIIKKIDLFIIQFANGVIIADENRIKQIAGSCPKKLIAIYNTPFDFLDIYKDNNQKNLNKSKFILGYIGLLQKERGFDYLLNVIKDIQEVKLIIGGVGNYEEEIKENAQNIFNLEFIGKVTPYEKTLQIESNFDSFLALYDPNIPNHKYSSPNKLFEAMMLGKSIIVSKDTGMDELVNKYQCGIIVKYGEEQELKDAILKLISMKEEGNNFYSKNSRMAYLNIFNPKIMEKRLLDFYKEILY